MGRKYLDDIGYDHQSNYENMTDERQTQFKVEKGVYGFDNSETWGLDTTMTAMLYERLKMFKEKTENFVDYSESLVEIDGETKNVDEWLDNMIQLCESYLTTDVLDDNYSDSNEEKKILEVWKIWSKVVLYMWW